MGDPKKEKPGIITIMAWLLVLLGAAAGIYGFIILSTDKEKFSLSNLGNYGSYLQGAVGSLWALAALLFIYETLRAQKKQLQHQETELQHQQAENERQQQSIKRQEFEVAFFQLSNHLNEITNQMQLREKIKSGQQIEVQETLGRACFMEYWVMFRKGYDDGVVAPDRRESLKFVIEKYSEFYADHQHELGHYFRTLYHVFRFIKSGDLDDLQKRRYSSLVRAQLSAAQLNLLFYNCLTPLGDKFKLLVEEFGLLEHLDKEALLAPSHVKFYAPTAYE